MAPGPRCAAAQRRSGAPEQSGVDLMKRLERRWHEISGAAGVAALAAIESAVVLAIVAMTGIGH
ncbi:hypothetical protein CFB84_28920 [Burkholderia aenigmatica]|uniref:Pyruvate carboxyltransferase domain-containing protein n=6 Tax=Burkholderia cepacia complex TaxID=87882 RepID=A0A228I7G1_9BURK|nr:hypothetical protein CFB84_28920 [Burkholderia aenigmatica]